MDKYSSQHGSYQGKRLPPFGRVLLAYQQESVRLTVPLYIYVGNDAKAVAWQEKCMAFPCTFLPLGEDFRDFRWPIAGQKVVVEDTGGMTKQYLRKFCFYLMSYKPRVLLLHSNTGGELFLLKGSEAYE